MKFAVIIAVVILCSGCLLDVSAANGPCSPGCIGTQAIICGSDGVVYNNGCAFSCARSKNPQLRSVSCSGMPGV
ncbi:hypothetical protein CHUAL_012604 [Chamberlinius hualienensis]